MTQPPGRTRPAERNGECDGEGVNPLTPKGVIHMAAPERASAQSEAPSRTVRIVLTSGIVVFVAMLAYLVYAVVGMNLRTSRRSENLEKARVLVAEGKNAVGQERFMQADAAFTEVLALLPDARSIRRCVNSEPTVTRRLGE